MTDKEKQAEFIQNCRGFGVVDYKEIMNNFYYMWEGEEKTDA
jgi:hypothetical protein